MIGPEQYNVEAKDDLSTTAKAQNHVSERLFNGVQPSIDQSLETNNADNFKVDHQFCSHLSKVVAAHKALQKARHDLKVVRTAFLESRSRYPVAERYPDASPRFRILA